MHAQADPAQTDPDGLFALAQQGDQAAWRVLFETCYPKVVRTIRRRLNSASAMRSRFDSADFVNDVWKSLAAKSDRFDFPTLASLVRFLEDAAQQKFVDEWRRLNTQKRDVGRERRLDGLAGEGIAYEPPSHDPTPSQFVQEHETRQRLLAAGRSEAERRIIELRNLGYSNEEISRETGWSLRAVQRFLKKLLDSWQAEGAEEA
jgi:RNA polymerase sigma factor (sigma-70 family)